MLSNCQRVSEVERSDMIVFPINELQNSIKAPIQVVLKHSFIHHRMVSDHSVVLEDTSVALLIIIYS